MFDSMQAVTMVRLERASKQNFTREALLRADANVRRQPTFARLFKRKSA